MSDAGTVERVLALADGYAEAVFAAYAGLAGAGPSDAAAARIDAARAAFRAETARLGAIATAAVAYGEARTAFDATDGFADPGAWRDAFLAQDRAHDALLSALARPDGGTG